MQRETTSHCRPQEAKEIRSRQPSKRSLIASFASSYMKTTWLCLILEYSALMCTRAGEA